MAYAPEFVLACLLAVVIIYLPGFIMARLALAQRTMALCVAPALSYALYSVLATVFPMLGVPAGPLTMLFVPSVLLAVLALRFGVRNHDRQGEPPGPTAWLMALYLLIGLVVGLFVFISVLPGFDAIMTGRDMPHHINGIRAFVDSRNFSSFGPSAYALPEDAAIHPNGGSGGGFYPSTWQSICALVVMLGAPDIAVVINAVSFVLAAVVTPLSGLAFMAEAYPRQRRLQAMGAVAVSCFVAFPWRFLTYGPLWPNLAGFAVILGVASLFVRATSSGVPVSVRVRCGAAMALSMFGMAYMHPNTVFALGVLLVPFCVWRLLSVGRLTLFGRRLSGRVAAGVFVAAAVALWLVLYTSPFMRAVVTMDWAFELSEAQALVNLATVAYVNLYLTDFGQPVLACALVLGALWAVRRRSGAHLWAVASYLLACLIVFANTVTDGPMQDLLSGFWYNDPVRVAALAAVCAVPVAAMGLDWACEGVARVLALDAGRRPQTLAAGITTAVALFGVCFPSFFLPGPEPGHLMRDRHMRVESETEYERISVAAYYSQQEGFITAEERRFLRDAVALIGRDALVINNPFDGSAIGYGDAGMRTFYRGINPMSSGYDTDESHVIRVHLDEVASNEEVQQALETIGAEYVVILGRQRDRSSEMLWNLDILQWQGIDGVTDDTPGFEVLLAEGECRLYRITV